MDIVKRIASLTLQFERGMLTPDEYAEALMDATLAKMEEVQKTYTFISICDGVVITKQTSLTYTALADALRCFRCNPYEGDFEVERHHDCPSDQLLSQLNSLGRGSVIVDGEDTPCGTDVMIAYVNR